MLLVSASKMILLKLYPFGASLDRDRACFPQIGLDLNFAVLLDSDIFLLFNKVLNAKPSISNVLMKALVLS